MQARGRVIMATRAVGPTVYAIHRSAVRTGKRNAGGRASR